MKRDSLFRIAFLFTLLVLIVTFATNIDIKRNFSDYSEVGERILFESIDGEKIRNLIEEDKLSDKEGMFYEVLEE